MNVNAPVFIPNKYQVIDSSTPVPQAAAESPTQYNEATGNQANEHLLANSWTLWYVQSDPTKSWDESLNEIASFGSVEGFWSLYNLIKPPSELSTGDNYLLFKRGIRPIWQAAENFCGGSWNMTLPNTVPARINDIWLDTLLLLIGGALDSHQVFGALSNVRFACHKMSIWTAPGLHEQGILNIGRQLRNTLPVWNLILQYKWHNDCIMNKSYMVPIVYEM